MFELIEISQGIKIFVLKSFIRKTISNFLLLFLEELIWENKNSKYFPQKKEFKILFCFISNPMQAYLQGNVLQNGLYQIKFTFPKVC
jgi:hypothetical protein